MKSVFFIEGLDCPEEVKLINKCLQDVKGIERVSFDVLKSTVTLFHSPTLKSEQLLQALQETGMPVTQVDLQATGAAWPVKKAIFQSLSLLALLLGFILNLKGFYLLTIVFSGIFVVPKAIKSFQMLNLDMYVLMTFAIMGALAIGQWQEGASIAFLFSLALFLEVLSMRRADKAISALMTQSPTIAHRICANPGDFKVCEIEVGDLILIKENEAIPLDACVEEGYSTVDESMLTGEPRPVHKQPGQMLYAGTLNLEGALVARVVKKENQTFLFHVQELIDKAKQEKAQVEIWIERFAKIYTPFMLLGAFLLAVLPLLLGLANWQDWIYRGLVLLVIACPCALVIATPVAMISAMTLSARKGILIKKGEFLEQMSKIRAFAIDKTGTLTGGFAVVKKIVPFHGHTEDDVLMKALALEENSTHPIARALYNYTEKRPAEKATSFQSVTGRGARAEYKGKLSWIGSHQYMHEMAPEPHCVHEAAQELEAEGLSVIALGNQEHVCGLIGLSDELRAEAKPFIQELKQEGLHPIVLLTGDRQKTADAMGQFLGIEAKGELLPQDKLQQVKRLKEVHGTVAMLGDGVNDAPAMAASSIGIAMGAQGNDVALSTCDIALMNDHLLTLPWLIRYSRRTLKIIKTNVTIALGLKALFIGLALLDKASLWMAIAADTGATLLVIANALRLLQSKD